MADDNKKQGRGSRPGRAAKSDSGVSRRATANTSASARSATAKRSSSVTNKAATRQTAGDSAFAGRVRQAFSAKSGQLTARQEVPGKAPGSAQVLGQLAEQMLAEQRARRRWGVVFKLLFFAIIIFTGVAIYTSKPVDSLEGRLFSQQQTEGEFVALVEVKGIISDDGDARATQIIGNLRDAMEHANSRGVLLDINSPGGSPVQAARVFRELVRLRDIYPKKPVYAVISDIGASGAYYIAAGAEAIFADPVSLVGSIGVIYSGFGLNRAIEKLGIDRRVLAAGANKSQLDPFLPRNFYDEAHWQTLLDDVHAQFIEDVRSTRPQLGERDAEVFSGQIYNGGVALEVGLVDGLGDLDSVARERLGSEELVLFDNARDRWEGLLKRFTQTLTHGLIRELAPAGLSMRAAPAAP